jgi:hypothetical protein
VRYRRPGFKCRLAADAPDADRAAVIARLHMRDDAVWLADLLMDLEDDVGEIARLRLVDGLRRTLTEP